MYKHEVQELTEGPLHTLSNEAGHRLSLLPNYSACITELELNGITVLDTCTPKEAKSNLWYKSTPLFPFPNRLAGGQYTWRGKTYQFPINDGPNGHALHGFGTECQFEWINKDIRSQQAVLTFRFDYGGELEYYPFPFSLTLHYQLSTENGAQFIATAKNTGAGTMPFGLGWHPYFLVREAGTTALQLPKMSMVGLDATMIPTGKHYDYDLFETPTPVASTVLDNCFKLAPSEDGRATVHLQHPDGTRLQYWQESGADQFPYLQVFTHPERHSIAIEPMSCNVDALNNGNHLWPLQPGEERTTSFGFHPA